MKKYYYQGPTFKLERGPGVPLLNFERAGWGPGSQGPNVPGPGVLVPLLHHVNSHPNCQTF